MQCGSRTLDITQVGDSVSSRKVGEVKRCEHCLPTPLFLST